MAYSWTMEENKSPAKDAGKTTAGDCCNPSLCDPKNSRCGDPSSGYRSLPLPFFNPLLNRLEKLKVPRWIGVLIVMLLLLIVLL